MAGTAMLRHVAALSRQTVTSVGEKAVLAFARALATASTSNTVKLPSPRLR